MFARQSRNDLAAAQPSRATRSRGSNSDGRPGPAFNRTPAGGNGPALRVGRSDDAHERQADGIAAKITVAPVPRQTYRCPCGGGCPRCQAQEQSRTAITPLGGIQLDLTVAPSSVNGVLASPGEPLDTATRNAMEPHLGADLSHVRVHTGRAAEQSAREAKAKAYTVGSHIVFGAGLYRPESSQGRSLLAHELVHTVQQSSPGAERILQRAPDDSPAPAGKALEPLEVIATRIAQLVISPHQTALQKKGKQPERGPAIAVVRDLENPGELFVSLNVGLPEKRTEVIDQALQHQIERIANGEGLSIHTIEPGTHAEVNALNAAIAAREARSKGAVREIDLHTFELHVVWLSGKEGQDRHERALTTAPRCEHCARITRGVTVTHSMFIAEGGRSGEITVPQRGVLHPAGNGPKRELTSHIGVINDKTPAPGNPTEGPGGSKGPTPLTKPPPQIREVPKALTAEDLTLNNPAVPARANLRNAVLTHAVGFGMHVGGMLLQQWVNDIALKSEEKDMYAEIAARINGKLGEIEHLLEQTRFRKAIFANVTFQNATIWQPVNKAGGGGMSSPPLLQLLDVSISTEDLQSSKYKQDFNGFLFTGITTITYSFPIVETELADFPPVDFERNMNIVANLLARASLDLSKSAQPDGVRQSLDRALMILGRSYLASGDLDVKSPRDSFLKLRSFIIDAIDDSWPLPADERLSIAARILDAIFLEWPGEIKQPKAH